MGESRTYLRDSRLKSFAMNIKVVANSPIYMGDSVLFLIWAGRVYGTNASFYSPDMICTSVSYGSWVFALLDRDSSNEKTKLDILICVTSYGDLR
jgi:hypothetical protein